MYTFSLSKNESNLGNCSNISQGYGQFIFSPNCDVSSTEISNKSIQKGCLNSRKIPIKIILNDDEEVISQENNSTTEDNSLHSLNLMNSPHSAVNFFPSNKDHLDRYRGETNRIISKRISTGNTKQFVEDSFPRKVVYIFNILKSRKKEKKYLRKKYNKIITRVHNMDCLLKKIKAKFLKFLFTDIKKSFKDLNIDVKKFDQCKEVRNLNVPHNRDNFMNLTILEVLINNKIIDSHNYFQIFSSENICLKEILNKKIKNVYQFEFLRSNYFRNWLRDPIKILSDQSSLNKNCEKFPNHSKNIFKSNEENYERYKKLLLHTSCNFLFYFQNNPLKFGKKQRD